MNKPQTNHGQPFRMLIGVVRHGDPSVGLAAVPIRSTYTSQVITDGAGRATVGLLTGNPAPATGSFVVASNDFSTGNALINVGPFTLVAGVDFAVENAGGALSTAVIAANIAHAFQGLPNLSAVSDALTSRVTISGSSPLQGFAFSVSHRGTVANFTAVTPANGYLAGGSPIVGPPQIT